MIYNAQSAISGLRNQRNLRQNESGIDNASLKKRRKICVFSENLNVQLKIESQNETQIGRINVHICKKKKLHIYLQIFPGFFFFLIFAFFVCVFSIVIGTNP